MRLAITGHGQNGEFISRNHFVTVGGQKFNFDVWKECSTIPIFPQGGTWLFDRAGWCPGLQTDVHEFEITDLITPGQPIEIDYGINGAPMAEANYLVSAQLVTYEKPTFQVDAEVIEVLRPTTQIEHARFNPACNEPMVRIKNNGQQPLTSMTIEYGEVGGESLTFDWTGNIDFQEVEDILLPIQFLNFWTALEGSGQFEVRVVSANGSADEYTNNNSTISEFNRPQFYDRPLLVRVRTNTVSYTHLTLPTILLV